MRISGARMKKEILSQYFQALKANRVNMADKYSLGKCVAYREILTRLGYNNIDLYNINFVEKELKKKRR